MPAAAELGVASVLDVVHNTFGITEGVERGDEYHIICPNPRHMDTHPSCSINTNTGMWNCFSCGIGGDLLYLGAIVLELPLDTPRAKRETLEHVKKLLAPRSSDALLVQLRRKIDLAVPKRHLRASQVRPSTSLGPYEPGPLTSLRIRGFSTTTLRRWGVRFVDEDVLLNKEGKPFTIKSSIAIPIRDQHGQILSWCFRRTDSSPSWQPRYLYPADAEISELWFGLQHHYDAPHVTIVEGALDAMWLDQCGYPALALLGSSMGDRKILQLQRYKNGVTLLGDRDSGGIAAVNRIGRILGNRVPLRVATYASFMGKDPQELHPIDVELVHERSQPWITWQMMHS